MSFEASLNPVIIRAQGVGKYYPLYKKNSDQLKQLLFGRLKQYAQAFWALQDLHFEITAGEIVGIIGRNGAGKSTLLQMLCGTLKPSIGSLEVHGQVAALLELGAGFNPDFTGRENIFMNAAILGLTRAQTQERLESIIAFADIGQFIDQPVKTYSSGMFMRLAFAVATSVEPKILIIDEALSVGDGAFARKSFERIMALKEKGTTILFCSHAMYQIEALCTRALWLEAGSIRMDGKPAQVTSAYQTSLNQEQDHLTQSTSTVANTGANTEPTTLASTAPKGSGRFTKLQAYTEQGFTAPLKVLSGKSTLTIEFEFCIDPNLPVPSLAMGLNDRNGLTIASATSKNDGYAIQVNAAGIGHASITFPNLPLLKGQYFITVFLLCENALHIYDQATNYFALEVEQAGLEQGLVHFLHTWNH